MQHGWVQLEQSDALLQIVVLLSVAVLDVSVLLRIELGTSLDLTSLPEAVSLVMLEVASSEVSSGRGRLG